MYLIIVLRNTKPNTRSKQNRENKYVSKNVFTHDAMSRFDLTATRIVHSNRYRKTASKVLKRLLDTE